jgi:hypothetical protein
LIKYTDRAKRKRLEGACASPEVELSFGSTVSGQFGTTVIVALPVRLPGDALQLATVKAVTV